MRGLLPGHRAGATGDRPWHDARHRRGVEPLGDIDQAQERHADRATHSESRAGAAAAACPPSRRGRCRRSGRAQLPQVERGQLRRRRAHAAVGFVEGRQGRRDVHRAEALAVHLRAERRRCRACRCGRRGPASSSRRSSPACTASPGHRTPCGGGAENLGERGAGALQLGAHGRGRQLRQLILPVHVIVAVHADLVAGAHQRAQRLRKRARDLRARAAACRRAPSASRTCRRHWCAASCRGSRGGRRAGWRGRSGRGRSDTKKLARMPSASNNRMQRRHAVAHAGVGARRRPSRRASAMRTGGSRLTAAWCGTTRWCVPSRRAATCRRARRGSFSIFVASGTRRGMSS